MDDELSVHHGPDEVIGLNGVLPARLQGGAAAASAVASPIEHHEVDLVPRQIGDEVLSKVGDRVHVSGISKGAGFAGVIKRHNFHRQPETHGQTEYLRHPGSIGQASSPSRVFKGMRMAGHKGNKRVTVKNLEIVKVDIENNMLVIKGAVPGANNNIVAITK